MESLTYDHYLKKTLIFAQELSNREALLDVSELIEKLIWFPLKTLPEL